MVAHSSHPDPEMTELRITPFRTTNVTILWETLNLNLLSNPKNQKNTYK